jgi:putative ABC transport system substrate-binding protein
MACDAARRTLLAALCLAPALISPGWAQERVFRVGFLVRAWPNWDGLAAFEKALRDLGYVEGKNIHVESRVTLGHEEALGPMVAELIAMRPDAIVTFGTPSARAALAATKTIPIVFTGAGDPIATGLASSLSRPGSNATGVSIISTELVGKRLDLLRQLSPGARRVAYLSDPANPVTTPGIKSMRETGSRLGIRVDVYEARDERQIENLLRTIPWHKLDGCIIGGDPIFMAQGAKIAAAVRAAKVPHIFPWHEYHRFGVLMSYDTDLPEVLRRGAQLLDKILKGAKPGDLPVEQVSTVRLTVDLKVARSLGIKVPETLLYRADEVIK